MFNPSASRSSLESEHRRGGSVICALLARVEPATGSDRMVFGRIAGVLVSDPGCRGDAASSSRSTGSDLQDLPGDAAQKFWRPRCGSTASRASTSALRSADQDRFIDFLVAIMPPAAAALGSVTNMLNLWLAGRILARLRAIAADPGLTCVSALRLPLIAPVLLIATLIGSYLAACAGLIMGIFGASTVRSRTRCRTRDRAYAHPWRAGARRHPVRGLWRACVVRRAARVALAGVRARRPRPRRLPV